MGEASSDMNPKHTPQHESKLDEEDQLPAELKPVVFRCPVHCVPEPCETCQAYIAAGL